MKLGRCRVFHQTWRKYSMVGLTEGVLGETHSYCTWQSLGRKFRSATGWDWMSSFSNYHETLTWLPSPSSTERNNYPEIEVPRGLMFLSLRLFFCLSKPGLPLQVPRTASCSFSVFLKNRVITVLVQCGSLGAKNKDPLAHTQYVSFSQSQGCQSAGTFGGPDWQNNLSGTNEIFLNKKNRKEILFLVFQDFQSCNVLETINFVTPRTSSWPLTGVKKLLFWAVFGSPWRVEAGTLYFLTIAPFSPCLYQKMQTSTEAEEKDLCKLWRHKRSKTIACRLNREKFVRALARSVITRSSQHFPQPLTCCERRRVEDASPPPVPTPCCQAWTSPSLRAFTQEREIRKWKNRGSGREDCYVRKKMRISWCCDATDSSGHRDKRPKMRSSAKTRRFTHKFTRPRLVLRSKSICKVGVAFTHGCGSNID